MNLQEFMNRISGVESGNPNATNPDSGAHGIFQIMPSNWSSWAQEAGLSPYAPQTAENQRTVAAHKMQAYFNQYNDWGAVAAAWYGGGAAAAKYAANKADPYLLRQHGKYPSIMQYVNRVLGSNAPTGGGTATTPTPTPTAPDMGAADERGSIDYQMAAFASILQAPARTPGMDQSTGTQ